VQSVRETVRVIRGEHDSTYVVAEEHDDGSLLLRPDTPTVQRPPPRVEHPPPRAGVTTPQAADATSQTDAAGPQPAAAGPQPGAPGAQPGAILEIRGLSVAYGPKKAVDDVSLQITRGEIFGLLGPNGAGKTSTLSAIEGLLKPQSGTVLLDGVDIRRQPGRAKAKMGVQLQATSFQSELTIKQIVRLYGGLYGMNLSDRQITDGLRAIGLEEEANKPFKQLSGGQQQRLSLYVAVVHDPVLLLLDEPTAGLDPQSRRQLWTRIEHLRQQGGSILLTTHSMEEAQAVCDRVAIIDHGTLLTTETPHDLIEKHRDDPRVREVAHGEVTLEDVFIGLTGSEIRD
jgi:ABC-2 type transport system ATP-binding protein